MLNLTELGKALGLDDEGMLKMLADELFKSAKHDIAEMRSAAERNDFDKIMHYAHSIKGSARNMRLDTLGNLAENVETKAKAKATDVDYLALVNELDATLESIEKNYRMTYN